MDPMSLETKPLRYIGYAVVCQEVPDEISLAFNISGCTHHCEGCHSQYLWEYKGEILKDKYREIILKNIKYISCICFLGGDQNLNELETICRDIKFNMDLKTCIYSGMNKLAPFLYMIENGYLDYIKIGEYRRDKGGLFCHTTNQRMYKCCFMNGNRQLIDITHKFWKKDESFNDEKIQMQFDCC